VDIDTTDLENIRVTYRLPKLNKDLEVKEIFGEKPDKTNQSFHIRIYSFNHNYANHMNFMFKRDESNKSVKQKIYHDESNGELIVFRTKKYLTIMIYRFEERKEQNFFYYEDIRKGWGANNNEGFTFSNFLVY